MRRKNITARRKAKTKKSFNKDLKSNEFYKKFEKIILNNINKNNFAVAVSGGADSLCLAYFSKIYEDRFKNKVLYLIVNHNLRKESGIEANKVHNILKKKDIKSNLEFKDLRLFKNVETTSSIRRSEMILGEINHSLKFNM